MVHLKNPTYIPTEQFLRCRRRGHDPFNGSFDPASFRANAPRPILHHPIMHVDKESPTITRAEGNPHLIPHVSCICTSSLRHRLHSPHPSPDCGGAASAHRTLGLDQFSFLCFPALLRRLKLSPIDSGRHPANHSPHMRRFWLPRWPPHVDETLRRVPTSK